MNQSHRTSTLIALALMACGPASSGDVGDNPGPGPGGGDDDPVVDAGDSNYLDAGDCGNQQEAIELINLGDPPDMLIVLDRSGSMQLAPGLFPLGESKWSIMKTAVETLLDARENNIRFGLSVFPTDNACGVAPGVAVPVDIANGSAINQWLDDHGPDGNTPAHQGLDEALVTYSSMQVNPEGRFVLFATDGTPNCNPTVDDDGGAETIAAVENLHSAGIETFVLGFGDALSLNASVLNDAALAGGRAQASSPYYYPAEDSQALVDTLLQIAGGIITPSCSYEVTESPPDPDMVTVTADGVPVPRTNSHSNGWDYHPDESTITFFGDYCSDIESGAISSVDFVFGCPGPIAD